MFPAARDLHKAYRLAYCLHPHGPTALRITREALFERFAVLGTTQRKRQRQRTVRQHAEPQTGTKLAVYKLPLTRHELLQASIYAVSAAWERDQEHQGKRQLENNVYRPTREDLLVRYVKLLVARTMDRPALFAALGLGCQLYQYSSSAILDLAPEVFPEANVRRIRGYLLEWITERFPTLPIRSQPLYGENKILTTPPMPEERQLIYEALAHLTPWGTPHVQLREPRFASLRVLFAANTCTGQALLALEAQRIHALIDASCAGFEMLVRAYNAAFPSDTKAETMTRDTPYDKLALPAFPHDDSQPPAGMPRFNPAPLSPEALLILQDAMRNQQQRRRLYRTGLLHVRVDGMTHAHFNPQENPCPPLYVPFSASAVEVYGEDEAGELLLAVFPLATLFAAEADRVLHVAHAGGHTFELAVADEAGAPEDALEGSMVQFTYTKASQPLPVRVWEALSNQWHHVEATLQRLFVHQGIPTVATALTILLVVSNLWWGSLLQSVNTPHEELLRGGRASTVRVMLAFRSSTTETEIRRFLKELAGRVVDGPLTGPEDGYYLVEISLGATGPTPSSAELARLQQDLLGRLQQAGVVRDVVLTPPDRPSRPAPR